MKPGTHPAYGLVAFRDRSTGDVQLTRSTLVERGIGKPRRIDTEGRVQAFERRYGAKAAR